VVSLRDAIATADSSNSPTTITFDSTVFATAHTIVLSSGQLDLTNTSEPTTIVGPSAGVTISGNNVTSVLQVFANVTASISDVVIANGNSTFWGGGIENSGFLTLTNDTIANNFATYVGGGIYNTETGGAKLVLTDVTIANNTSATSGGGLFNDQTAVLTNVTVSGNSAPQGGGILSNSHGEITTALYNVTVANNSAGNNGGGIWNAGVAAQFTLGNTIVAGNTVTGAGSVGPDAFSAFTSLGHNLIGKTDGSSGWVASDHTGTIASPLNASLGSLASNGGPTQTLLPQTGSPAIDNGSNTLIAAGINTDQRGFPRTANGAVDIGAVEVQIANVWISSTGGDWDTASNWSLGHVPTAAENAVINLPGTYTVMHSVNDADSVNSLISSESITFSGGSLTVATILQVNNAFTLSGSAVLAVGGNEYIGDTGTGTFTQTGGQNTCAGLYLGYSAGDSGFYSLSGTGNLTVGGSEFVGNSGSGTFNQSGGTNTISSSNSLYLGNNSGSIGIYSLSGTGSLSVGGYEQIGYSGAGTFTQNGGSNFIGGVALGIASNSGSTGNYTLTSGTLVAANSETVGYAGQGQFNQSGGTNSVNTGAAVLWIGQVSGGIGSYSLSNGSLSVGNTEYVGGSGTGTFSQTGGTNITNGLTVGAAAISASSYTLGGTGSLSVSVSNAVNSSSSFTLENGANFTTNGNFTNNGTLTIGPSSTLRVRGNLVEGNTAVLISQIGGTPATGSFGFVTSTGSATLGGTLEATLVNGFVPSNNSYSLATFPTHTGSFSVYNLPTVSAVTVTPTINSSSAMLTFAASTVQSIYDATTAYEAGWISTTNPNSPWSYGYSSTATAPVTLYNTATTGALNGGNEQFWLSPAVNIGYSPTVALNNGPALDNGNINYLEDELVLAAGLGGQYADVVFTAPASGLYAINSSFRGDQHGVGTKVGVSADGSVLLNSTVTSLGQVVPFVGNVSLTAGQTVEFSVGPGSGAQNTGLAATIALVAQSTTSSTTTVTSSNATPAYGQPVTFTATVTPNVGVGPTGTVQFQIDDSNVGSPVALSGNTARYTTSTLSARGHSIVAVYSGDANFSTSTSSTLAQNVAQVNTTTDVASSNGSDIYGQSLTFTATVTPNVGIGPTGAVQFQIDGNNVGSPVALSGNTARYTTSTLSTGGHSIVAVYGGDANFTTSISPTLTQNVAAVADLQPQNFNPASSSLQFGQSVGVTWADQNVGNAPAIGAWTDLIYFSPTPTITNSSVLLLSQPVNSTSLAARSGLAQSTTVTLPSPSASLAAGPYYLIVDTDAGNTVGEVNTTNNVQSSQIQVAEPPLPALSASSVVPPVQGYSGRAIAVSWTVTNSGQGATDGTWNDEVYLVPAGGGTATALGGLTSPVNLAPRASYTRTDDFTLPDGISGQYAVEVVADSDGGVFESTPSNGSVTSQPFSVILSAYPDLQVQSVTVPPTAVAGDPATFAWTVVNNGTGGTDVAQWTDDLYLSTTPSLSGAALVGSATNPSYLAPGDTYSQSLTATVPSGLSGHYYAIVVTNADHAQFELNGGTDNVGASATQINIQSTTAAEGFLHVASVTVSPAPPNIDYIGSTVNVTWMVTNTGTGDITPGDDGYWDDGLALSQTPSWNGVNGYWLGGHKNSETETLLPGQSYTSENSFVVPQGLTSGTWYVVVVPDTHYFTGGGGIGSSDIPRDQGAAALDIQIPPAPQLQVGSVSAGSTVQAGQPLSVGWSVINNGFAPTSAGSWQDSVYLSPISTTTISSSDILLGTTTHTGDLAPTDSYSSTQSFTVPSNLTGAYYVVVYDSEANAASVSAAATNITPQPVSNLSVSEVTTPSSAAAGQAVSVSWTVTNNGPAISTASQWTDQVVLSSSNSVATGVVLDVGTFTHSGALGVGQSYQGTASFQLPDSLSGTYYLIVTTNADGSVNETSGNNNSSSATFNVTPLSSADLEVTNLQVPSTAYSGQPVTIGWTVTNGGAASIPPNQTSWVDSVYLSSDESFADATLVGNYTQNGTLAAGASYDQSAQITLPNGISGNYTIFVVTDSANSITGDSTTTNHTAFKTLNVQLTLAPQLSVSGITTPATVYAGEPITVNWNVNNVGNGATAVSNWTDSVYLSLDQYIDATSVYLGSVQHSGALAPGAGYGGSLTATLPGNISGAYYVFVVTDSGHAVFQNGQTATNTSFLPTAINVSLAPLADLVPTAVTVPTTGQLGQAPTTPITWTVTNEGTNATSAGQWSDSVYLSQTDTWSASDPLIATVVHTGDLQPGASYTASTDAAIPGVIVPGNYYVIVRTDVLNDVREASGNIDQIVSTSTISMLDVPTLAVGSPATGTIADGQNIYYKVNVQAGQELIVSPSFGATDAAQFFLRFGTPPTGTQFDQVFGNASDLSQQLQVPATQAGSYYILLAGETGAGSGTTYTISAQTPSFGITGASPNYGSNAGDATVVVNGTLLDNKTTVTLDKGNAVVAAAVQQWWVNSTTIWATFDLQGVAAGNYNIVATDGANSSTLANAFTVNSGPVGALKVYVVPPGTVRPGSTDQVEIQYTNIGNTDISAPLLDISETGNIELQAPGQSSFSTSPVIVLGINNNGPAGILSPGSTGTFVLNFQAPSTEGSFDIGASPITGVGAVGSALPPAVYLINWSSVLGTTPPTGISAMAWSAIVNNFVADVGNTWGTYDSDLAQNATYLSQLGTYTDNVSTLTSFIIGQAAGAFGVQPLASSTDLSVPGVGPALALSREYTSSINNRDTLGSFGYGWTDQWQTSLSVDSSGNATITSDGVTQQYLKQTNGAFISPTGDTNTLTYDQGLYILQSTNGGLATYNSAGQLVSIQDSNGNSISTVFTGSLLTGLVDSDGQSITFSYNADGRITQAVDSAGDSVTYTYDPSGQYLLSVTTAQGTTNYTYNAGSGVAEFSLASISFPGGTHNFFTYDSQGRLASTSEDGGVNSVTYSYNQPGEITSTNALGDATQSFYDNSGLLVRTIDPLGNATVYGYDPNTLLVSQITDSANQTETLTYNPSGDLLTSVDPLGNKTTFTYGIDNQISSLTDANGNVTKYSYDAAGDLLSTSYANGTSSSSTFNPEGEALSFVNQNGQATSYTYNSEGLLTSETFPGSLYTYTYDSHGDLLTATDSTGTTTFTYNSALELTEVSYPAGMYLKFTYDSGGRRTQMVDQTGFTTNYQYNSAGDLAGLTDGSGNPIVTYTYNAAGELTEKVNSNGMYTTYSYDADGNVLDLVNHAPGGATSSSFVYAYNSLGLETSETTLDGTWTYSYDADGELTHAVFVSTNPSVTSQNLVYNYDAMGNRTSTIINGVTTIYTVNNMNQYTSVGGVPYTYDSNGNLISDGTNTYTFNPINELTAVASSSDTTTYTYNALGQRVASAAGGLTTQYLIDPDGLGNVVGTYDGSGNVIADYRYGLGLVSQISASGSVYFYDFDALGSTVAMTNSAGATVASYSYLPFGGSLSSSGTVANPFQFVGKFGVQSAGVGLSFMLERYYAPTIGRFISRDPLSLGGGDANLYRYSLNNPTQLLDPIGLTAGQVSGWDNAVKFWNGINSFIGVNLTGVENSFKLISKEFSEFATISHVAQVLDQGSSLLGVFFGGYELAVARNVLEWWNALGGTGLSALSAALPYLATIFELSDPIGWILGGAELLAFLSNEFAPGGLLYNPTLDLPIFPPGTGQTGTSTGPGDIVIPHDPNDLIGPIGAGDAAFVAAGQTLPYRIDFVNESTATAPAQVVTITDQLPTTVNWQTFQLGEIVFGSYVINVPAGRSFYSTVVQLGASLNNLEVDIDAGIDPTTGIVHWTFSTIDPATNEPPTNPLEGFLPPDDAAGDGEAYVTYSVNAATNEPTGTLIDNQATITFDTQPPITTDQAVNTIDSVAPTSTVAALPTTEASPNFTVSWSGVDDPNGSGVADFDIYVSINGGAFQPWLSDTTATSAIYTGQTGDSYGFYSVAADNAGNVQATPSSAQATTTVAKAAPTLTLPAAPTLTYDGTSDVTNWAKPTLTGITGLAAPTGTATLLFYAGSTGTGTPLTSLPVNAGTYTVVASYGGDSNYGAAQTSVTFTVNRAPTTTTLGTPPASIIANGTTSVTSWATATVTGVAGAPAPSGLPTYTYYLGSTATGTPLTSSPTTAGTYTVVASYGGNSNYLASSASTTFTISPAVALTTTMLVNGLPSTGAIANTQRSQVTSLVINFSTPVTLSAGAITLTDQDPTNPFGAAAGTSVPFTLTSSNGGETYTLTFSGAGFVSRSSLATSLPNGHYVLTVNFGDVSSGTAAVPSGSQTLLFHRLYGDLTNAGYVTTVVARSDASASNWATYEQYLDNDGAAFSAGFDSADSSALTAAESFVTGTQEQNLWNLYNE
jgi:RHS repeat-associated protein